jgi:hypothetical protein
MGARRHAGDDVLTGSNEGCDAGLLPQLVTSTASPITFCLGQATAAIGRIARKYVSRGRPAVDGSADGTRGAGTTDREGSLQRQRCRWNGSLIG